MQSRRQLRETMVSLQTRPRALRRFSRIGKQRQVRAFRKQPRTGSLRQSDRAARRIGNAENSNEDKGSTPQEMITTKRMKIMKRKQLATRSRAEFAKKNHEEKRQRLSQGYKGWQQAVRVLLRHGLGNALRSTGPYELYEPENASRSIELYALATHGSDPP
jgi:hypothetical protein